MYDTSNKHGSTKGNKQGEKRFVAVDPVKGNVRNPQSLVQYTYVLNNPLMYVDSLGLVYHLTLVKNGGGQLYQTDISDKGIIKVRSMLYDDINDIQRLLDKTIETGTMIGSNKEKVNFGKTIGQYVDLVSGTKIETTVDIIHYGKNGAHIVPARPE